ncbi:hypothetical protein N7511_005071 [Penicillium nucicola]|nr:hypothetical protein N7511_011563 [Penicillium nucicola]KAJ5741224.1 hypothetical protein N7511_011569 [Penicillium nucicola]KAJ5761715.1 hypothetical protein N7511_005097 [Penicillium nucicola]KAJ5761720.1 hypothetical protein N7511_005102 [Penicillium nucicola]KAJ5764678.1 hypothetical protein N7511_005036 [Penicillium nucicola]
MWALSATRDRQLASRHRGQLANHPLHGMRSIIPQSFLDPAMAFVSTGQYPLRSDQGTRPRLASPSKRPGLPDPLMGGVKPTNLAKVGLTLSDS